MQIGAHVVYGRKISKLGRKYIFDKMQPYISLPSEEEFFNAAKKFTNSYMELFNTDKRIKAFDHLVWPQNSAFIDKYFTEDFGMIVVHRDPRDVFLLNKYFWHKPPRVLTKPFFPTDAMEFCDVWRRNVSGVKKHERVLEVFFEDLVYNTVETEKRIMHFLDLKAEQHIMPRKFFDPNKSIENTQVFLLDNEIWREEARIIEETIPDTLFSFPYERKCDSTKWFDTEGVDIKQKKKVD